MTKVNFRSIKFKTLSYFLLFAFTILGLVWLLQIVLLETNYKNMKQTQVERITKKAAASFGEDDFQITLNSLAYKNELTIIVLQKTDSQLDIISTAGFRGGMFPGQFPAQFFNSFIDLFEKSDNITYIVTDSPEYESLVCGSHIVYESKDIYFYVNASLFPLESTTAVLSKQLIIVTVVCMIIAVLVSFYLSARISQPVKDLTNGAALLAEKKGNVKFEGKGFDEIEKLADTLNFAAGEIAKSEDMRRDLISNVSHELRTPLTVIKFYAEMLNDFSGNDKQKREEHLSTILSETERLSQMVNDLLDLSNIQAGRATFKKERLNVSEEVRSMVLKFANLYASEGFVFNSEIVDDAFVLADGQKMEQVFYNLLGNAVNYSGENKQISIRLSVSVDSCLFEVIDSGVGISEEDQKHIFEKFFRSEEKKREKSGSGIGLYVVKTILDAQGFSFGVSSKLSEGSRFWIKMPLDTKSDLTFF